MAFYFNNLSILYPAFSTVSITCCSVAPLDDTVSILSRLTVSTSQWAMPAALSRCGFTDATHPLQLIFVLNMKFLFSVFIIIYFNIMNFGFISWMSVVVFWIVMR